MEPRQAPPTRAADTAAARVLVPGLAVLTAAVTFAVGSIGGGTPEAIGASALAAAAACAVIMLVRTAPVAAFGLLFFVASLSRLTIDMPFGHVRIEQPAILGSFVALALLGRLEVLRNRLVLAVGACFALYLGVMTISSALNAPQLTVSMRLIIWTAISMLAAPVAFVLLAGRPGEEQHGLSLVGGLQAGVGLMIGLAFLVLGPQGIPGMQISPGEVPKVASVDYEANLFASLLALLAPFALEEWRRRRTMLSAAIAVVTIVASGLGVTRGAYAGLAAGLIVYFGLLAVRLVPRHVMRPLVGLTIVAVLLAPATSAVLLPTVRPASPPSHTPGQSGSSPGTSFATESPTPTPAATPTPQPTPVADTLAFRLDRVPTAISDIKTSPIIGLGAATYGQRHIRSDAPGVPDYIGMLALVALYETGVLGALGLAAGMLLLLALLARVAAVSGATTSDVGRAAAYAASIVSFLVSYEATNAMWFSINWLIVGAALAFVVHMERAREGTPATRTA